MARFGLIGPSYPSTSAIADSERTMNWYLESVESGQGQSQAALYPKPGLAAFANIAKPVRALLAFSGMMFAVGGGNLYSVNAAGNATLLGAVGNDGNPASMCTNGSAGNQLLVCSAGKLYIYWLPGSPVTPNTFVGPLADLTGVPWIVGQCSGYGIAVLAGTNKFQVSNLLDMSQWNPLGVQQVLEFPEKIGGFCVAYQQLWFFGQDGHAQVYYDSGANPYTPFSVVGAGGAGFMEEGIDAPYSLVVADNTPMWLGGNANGAGMAWRANGYSPMRISNHAVEAMWASYPQGTSDAVGYAYRDRGHTFSVWRFPSANGGLGATWAYDAATQAWCERGFWNGQGPTGYTADLSTCHCFAFGRHFVGDWNSGNIYAMNPASSLDNGQPIRFWRRSPHLANERQRIVFNELEVVMEAGDGPMPPLVDGQGNPRDPQAMLRWSDDGGRTFGNEHWTGMGQAGNFLTRVRWQQLGEARDRVFDLVITDPIGPRIIEGDLRATPGFTVPTERYSRQLAKVT